jgi:hypothetical protein
MRLSELLLVASAYFILAAKCQARWDSPASGSGVQDRENKVGKNNQNRRAKEANRKLFENLEQGRFEEEKEQEKSKRELLSKNKNVFQDDNEFWSRFGE